MIRFFALPDEKEAMERVAKDASAEDLLDELLDTALPDERYALSDGCLLTMYLADDEILFSMPAPYRTDASASDALLALEELARHADLPLQYVGVAPEDFASLLPRYRHTNVDLIDSTEGAYRVRILTECMLISKIPVLTGERLTLSSPEACDENALEALENDELTNRYFRDERSTETREGSALDTALREFSRGISIPFAIRAEGETVGDLTLYAFDGKGGAELAVRILPSKRRLGYAKEAMECAFCFAEGILSLTHLDGVVKVENTPSLALLSSLMEQIENDGERVTFRRNFSRP